MVQITVVVSSQTVVQSFVLSLMGFVVLMDPVVLNVENLKLIVKRMH